MTPLWYEWDGIVLLMSTTKAPRKYRNLRRDPRLALTILDPESPYRYLQIRRRAELRDDPAKELIDRLAVKYLGMERYPWDSPADERVIIRVVPEEVITYC